METGDNAINMCRSIKPLYNFDPPVTDEEVRAASLQFVRKISGYSKPSKVNEAAFTTAIEAIIAISNDLLVALKTDAPPRNRLEQIRQVKARVTRSRSFGG